MEYSAVDRIITVALIILRVELSCPSLFMALIKNEFNFQSFHLLGLIMSFLSLIMLHAELLLLTCVELCFFVKHILSILKCFEVSYPVGF